MLLLAIDPGETTGTATLHVNSGRPVMFVSSRQEGPYMAPLTLKAIESLDPVKDRVIIERPPIMGHDPRLVQFFGELGAAAMIHGIKPILINPGEWKPYIKRLTKYGGYARKLNIHEKDATGIALFYAIKMCGATYAKGCI